MLRMKESREMFVHPAEGARALQTDTRLRVDDGGFTCAGEEAQTEHMT